MSIRDRLDDARLLFAQDRKEGALLSVLVAVAATSRRRYPKPMRDEHAFIRFLTDETPATLTNCVWIPTAEIDYQRRLDPKLSADGKPIQGGFWFKVPGAQARGWADGMMPLPTILYKLVRCNLAHEAELPSVVEFIDTEPGHLVFKVEDARLVLSHALMDGLVRAITFAPENADEFPTEAEMPPDVVAWMLFGKLRDRQSAYLEARARRSGH